MAFHFNNFAGGEGGNGWGRFFIGARQFIVSLVILTGGLFFASVILGLLQYFNPEMLQIMAIAGPYSAFSWAVLLVMMAGYPAALAVWVFGDAGKFKKQGINIRPVLWAIGTALPLIFIVFPVYYVLRDVVWREKLKQNSAEGGNGQKKFSRNFVLNTIAALFVIYIAVVVTGLPEKLNKPRTEAQVAKIHATKLTLDDVLGKNLPPDPGALADATIQGVDANKNGIRDDVELAIFKAYPYSAKTRAVLLQYALALQMEVTQPFVNMGVVTAVAQDSDRAYMCIGEITPRADIEKFIELSNKFHTFVENRQLNNEERRQAQKDFYNGNLGSYSSLDESCDLNLSKLLN